MELKAGVDLRLYLIDPGNEIFAPMWVWKFIPTQQQLRKTDEWIEIRLSKEVTVVDQNDCNTTKEYVYGGILSMVLNIYVMLLLNITNFLELFNVIDNLNF